MQLSDPSNQRFAIMQSAIKEEKGPPGLKAQMWLAEGSLSLLSLLSLQGA